MNIIHSDLKLDSICYVSNRKNSQDIKIIDFGFFKQADNKSDHVVLSGTPLYMAPELFQRKSVSSKVDVWSLGIIVYQLLTSKTPFDAKNLVRIKRNICEKDFRIDSAL